MCVYLYKYEYIFMNVYICAYPDQRISVDQAIQHPWILGRSMVSRIPAGKRTSLTNSEGSSPSRRKNTESASKSKTQRQQNKAKVTVSERGPQLELVISRPLFGSCSWTHRGSHESQTSYDSQGMSPKNEEASLMDVMDASHIEDSNVLLSDKYSDRGGANDNLEKKDNVSFFRKATGGL
jgi:hypothetical protein